MEAQPQTRRNGGSPVQPKPIAVFNRTRGVLGYSLPEFPNYIEIPSGRWTIEDASKQQFPRAFVYNHLAKDKNVSVQFPYARWMANDDKHLTIASPIDTVTGFGKMSINLIAALDKLRDDLMLFPTAYWHYEGTPTRVQEMMSAPHIPTKWTLAITIPPELEKIPSRNIILFTMWETLQIPEGWGEIVNKYCKALVLPTENQIEIWKSAGVTVPIFVCPLGIDPHIYAYQERPARGDKPFTILMYGFLSGRKSPLETWTDVVWRAFGSDDFGAPVDDWKMIIKTRRKVVGAGMPVEFNDPHVEFISGDFYESEMAELCYRSDVGIMLSHFEGWGLPMREMMATGLPTIVSDNSGHSVDCDPVICYPVPNENELELAGDQYSTEKEKRYWYIPDYGAAARMLRQEYDDWKTRGKTQSDMGTRAAEYIHQNRTWDMCAVTLNDIINAVMSNHALLTHNGIVVK